MIARRLAALAGLVVLVVAVTGCGRPSHPTVADANNDGVYIDAGPITYQLQVSRELNPYSPEDSEYVTGLPRGTAALKPNEIWFGVFLNARNQTSQPARTTDRFVIVDTEGNRYYPLTLDPTVNKYAWHSQVLQPSGTEPAPDTPAFYGPSQGSLVLFKLPTVVYSNRPLTLYIYPHTGRPASISLDL